MNTLPTPEVFTAKDVAHLSGLSHAMLDYLVREEFVVPSGDGPRGRGNPRRFTYSDLVLLRVIATLLASGIEIRRLAQALRELKRRFNEPNAIAEHASILVTDGKEVYLTGPDGLEPLTSSKQLPFAFLVDLGACRREIEALRHLLPGRLTE